MNTRNSSPSGRTLTLVLLRWRMRGRGRLGCREIRLSKRNIDGKIKESWRLTDSLGLMQQLGMEPKPKEGEK